MSVRHEMNAMFLFSCFVQADIQNIETLPIMKSKLLL
jgi:hypothetical protein